MLPKSWFYTSFPVDNKTTSNFQIFNVFFLGLEFPMHKECLQGARKSFYETLHKWFHMWIELILSSFCTGIFKARTTTEESTKEKKKKTECWGSHISVLVFNADPSIWPSHWPLCASVSSYAKWGLNVFFTQFSLQIWNKRCLKWHKVLWDRYKCCIIWLPSKMK